VPFENDPRGGELPGGIKGAKKGPLAEKQKLREGGDGPLRPVRGGVARGSDLQKLWAA